MLRKGLLLLAFLSSIPSSAVDVFEQLKSVPLCRALESLRVGDQIPVVVSGIYTVDYMFDPDELQCHSDVEPLTCVEFGPGVVVPEGFDAFQNEWGTHRVSVTFRGVLYGPPDVPVPPFDPSVSSAHRALLRNSQRTLYCGNRYRTKLVVHSVDSFGPVPEATPWPEQQHHEDVPMPLEMALPRYPPIARKIDYEGVALVAVTVVAGEVTDARIQFGDAVVVTEVLANVQTWRFASDVSTSFTVEYDFHLETRTVSQGKNPRFEMRLPTYVKVIGASDEF